MLVDRASFKYSKGYTQRSRDVVSCLSLKSSGGSWGGERDCVCAHVSIPSLLKGVSKGFFLWEVTVFFTHKVVESCFSCRTRNSTITTES